LALKVVRNEVGFLQSNSYVVFDDETKEAVVIDAGDDAWLILETIHENRLKVRAIYATHCHFDHVLAVDDLKQAIRMPFYIHRGDLETLAMMKEMTRRFLSIEVPDPPSPDGYVEDGDHIPVGSRRLKVIHTPGHSPGSVCFYGEGLLFSGDTLFQGSVGRTDAPGGSTEQLVQSILEKLFTLPEDVKVYPGHGPDTTIGWEKKHNPFVGEDGYFRRGR